MRWLVRGEGNVPEGTGWLNEAEAARAGSMRFTKRRTEYLLRRYAGKCAVAAAIGMPEDPTSLGRIAVLNRWTGAPYVEVDGADLGMDVSLTDRAGWAVCLVGADLAAVGCDLEIVEPRSSGFVADFLTPAEQELVRAAGAAPGRGAGLSVEVQRGSVQQRAALPEVSQPDRAQQGEALPEVALPGVALPGVALPGVALPGVALPGVALPGVALPGVALPGEARHAMANLIWSAKESALKVLRTGLRADTRTVEVVVDPGHLGPGAGWQPLQVRSGSAVLPGWWRRDGVFLLTIVTSEPTEPPRELPGSAPLSAAAPVHSWLAQPLV